MERIGQLLAGRIGTIPTGNPNPDRDTRVAAVVARVDGLQTRVDRMKERQDEADDRLDNLERNEERR